MLKLYSNIKTRRIELGLSQYQLAMKMGYSDKTMISKIENGQVDLAISKVIDFAEALETEPNILIGWTEKEEEPTEVSSLRNQLNHMFNQMDLGEKKTFLNLGKALRPNE